MVYAFKDIEPVAPVHYLIIPKEHISGASAVNSENSKYVAHIFEVAAKIAADEGLCGRLQSDNKTAVMMQGKVFIIFISMYLPAKKWAGAATAQYKFGG